MRPLDRALNVVHEVAASRRLEAETLALSRCHGRVLLQDVAPTGTAGSAESTGAAIARGSLLTPMKVALAASLGVPALTVSRRPTVAVFTTGDDLVEPGMPLAAGQAYDANRELLMGLLRAEGLEPTAWPRLPDDPQQIEIALRDAGCAFDLVVICESPVASAGSWVTGVLQRFGCIHLDDLAPTFCASVRFGTLDQACVLGLPDAPVALAAAWLTLGRALVDGLQGRLEPRPVLPVRLACPVVAAQCQGVFLPVRVVAGDNGLQVATQTGQLADANALIMRTDGVSTVPTPTVVNAILL